MAQRLETRKMSQEFTKITHSSDYDVQIIEIVASTINDYDLAHATSDEIDKTFNQSNTTKAVIDLKNVEFVTSVGLVVFSRLIVTARQLDLRIVLCNASEMLADVLEVTRLVSLGEKRISLAPNLDVALACFDQSGEG